MFAPKSSLRPRSTLSTRLRSSSQASLIGSLRQRGKSQEVALAVEEVIGPTRLRGGYELPVERPIPSRPPRAPRNGQRLADPEARAQALERRNAAHYRLIRAVADRADAAAVACTCTQFADVLGDGCIFEMKSVEHDRIEQVRAAIGQLYHYRFIHRHLPGYRRPQLYAVFDQSIAEDLADYLAEIGIGTIWYDGHTFRAGCETDSIPVWPR
jgi:hypothetical protein